jgi:hypothetical protein
METKIYDIFSAINNVFQTLNLFLNKYLAEIQLPGNGIWLMAALRTHRVRDIFLLEMKQG